MCPDQGGNVLLILIKHQVIVIFKASDDGSLKLGRQPSRYQGGLPIGGNNIEDQALEIRSRSLWSIGRDNGLQSVLSRESV